MHNLTKIKIFRILLLITFPFAILFVFPWVLFKKKNATGLFFFLDRYSIGGAQRVYLDILESVRDIDKMVYFTRRSKDARLKETFYSMPHTHCRDIHFWCDNLLLRLFSVHYFAFYVNRHKGARILGSNSTFFYDMLPFFTRSTNTVELFHNFSYGKKGMEFFGLANHRYLQKRMIIDGATKENIRRQYDQYGVNPVYFERVQLVEFGVAVPAAFSKDLSLPLKILYAGRGGPQKRVWLVNRIAEYLLERQEPVEFHFAGTMMDDLSETVRQQSILHGELREKEALNTIYRDCHVLILTSAFEGFPMVIKEAMAYGCVPLATALDGIRTHLTHGSNCLLITEVNDEAGLVTEAIGHIRELIGDAALLSRLSENVWLYAQTHFTRETFLSTYRELLTGKKNTRANA